MSSLQFSFVNGADVNLLRVQIYSLKTSQATDVTES
jgi:hypothetical protein